MDVATCELLSDYNAITNSKMNEIIIQMNNDQWIKEFNGYFNSIKSLTNHIFIGDYNWLKRFSKLREFRYINSEFFSKEIIFSENAFQEIDEYIQKRKKLDIYINQFIKELTDYDLINDLQYRDSHGKDHKKNFGLLILHVFNHQTHHRGMISLYLEMMGINNDYSNLAYIF